MENRHSSSRSISHSSHSIKFGGIQNLIEEENIHFYEPDEVPMRSILKNIDKKDFRSLKDIDGKAIKHHQSEFQSTMHSEAETTA